MNLVYNTNDEMVKCVLHIVYNCMKWNTQASATIALEDTHRLNVLTRQVIDVHIRRESVRPLWILQQRKLIVISSKNEEQKGK